MVFYLRPLLVALSALVLSNCGAPKAKQQQSHTAVQIAAPEAEAETTASPRELAAVSNDANVVFHADPAGSLEPLLRVVSATSISVDPSSVALSHPAGAEADKLCGFSPWSQIESFTLFGSFRANKDTDDGDWFVLVVSAKVPIDRARSCAVKLTAANREYDGWFHNDELWGTTHGDWLLFGNDQQRVREAIARLDAQPQLIASIAQTAEQGAITLTAQHLNGLPLTDLEVVLADARVDGLQRARAVFAEVEQAVSAEQRLKSLAASLQGLEIPAEPIASIRQAIGSLSIQRSDCALSASVQLPSSAQFPELKTLISSAAAGLVFHAVRRYITRSKADEARETLWRIARTLEAYVSDVGTLASGKKMPLRFPQSAPRVPPEVPKADGYQSQDSDWSGAWQDIGFSLSEAQHYSYEIETLQDRRSATIRAIGDVDGDGNPARFELTLKIKNQDGQDIVLIAPEITEYDPLE